MANPFGEVVDDDKLRQLPRYVNNKIITQEDRAREAINLEHEFGKSIAAQNYVEGLKREFGSGVTTLCMVYNATGETLKYSIHKDWFGNVGRTPYPAEIQNGQWASFLHVKTTAAASGSMGSVVFTGYNSSGNPRDILISWSTPWGLQRNSVYSEEGSVGSFPNRWNSVYNSLNRGGIYEHRTRMNGLDIEVKTASSSSPICRAVITIPFRP